MMQGTYACDYLAILGHVGHGVAVDREGSREVRDDIIASGGAVAHDLSVDFVILRIILQLFRPIIVGKQHSGVVKPDRFLPCTIGGRDGLAERGKLLGRVENDL
jgi:hypothetical protein